MSTWNSNETKGGAYEPSSAVVNDYSQYQQKEQNQEVQK